MWVLYYAGIYLYMLVIRISSLWNPKARLWLSGRKNWKSAIEKVPTKKNIRIWFHVSSLGEFEQSRPVIELIKLRRPETEIILSFFSPSGYEIRKDYGIASVLYLPPDLPGNASKWITQINPDLAIFVKYDLWPGFLHQLAKKQIPAILISAHWDGNRFSSHALSITRRYLKGFNMIFFQRKKNLAEFQEKGFNNLAVAGDTRIDRTMHLPSEAKNKISQNVVSLGPFHLVAGSTWPEDEKLILEAVNSLNLRAILAPHDVSPGNISRLESQLSVPFQKLSAIKPGDVTPQILLVDRIGHLSILYALGEVAYVGGGFGRGIHNILEPMSHGKPVIFGPNYRKFPEAVDAIEIRAAFVISSAPELLDYLMDLLQNRQATETGKKAREYIEQQAGASEMITNYILNSIPFPAKE